MEEIINSLLEKPLAFIITIGGIIFLGLSGLTKIFQIEIDTKNSKRLFFAGIFLIIIGIPIYYFGTNHITPDLKVQLLKIELFENDTGHTCNNSYPVHVRETYKIDGVRGEKLTKVILNQKQLNTQDIHYQDLEGNFAINYCFKPNTERIYKVVIISNSGKISQIVKYKVSTLNQPEIIKNAPELSEY
jgi:hypothetical protein